MSLHAFLPWLLLGAVFSIFTAVFAANSVSAGWLVTALGSFAILELGAAIGLNAGYWQQSARETAEDRSEPLIEASQTNARLMAIGYYWAAAAMAAIYTLTPLDWRHDWQYALVFILIATGLLTYSGILSARGSALRQPAWLSSAAWATGAQLLLALSAAAYLLTGTRLAAGRPEWAAHHLFLVGALLLAGLSTVALLTYRSLAEDT